MNNSKVFFGGAQLGLASITVPLALLKITKNYIFVYICFVRLYKLSRNDIVNFKESSTGLEINTILPKKIVFWCIDSKRIINYCNSIGFIPMGDINNKKHIRESPIKLWSILIILLSWVFAYFLDYYLPKITIFKIDFFNSYSLLIHFLTLVLLILIWKYNRFQNYILRPNHDFEEIKPEFFTVLFIFIIIWLYILIWAIV